MPHNDRSRPASQWVTYAVPTARDLAQFDLLQYQAVNGDLGGNYAPKTPIVIGGAGLGLGNTSPQIIGGVTTQAGGRLILGKLGAGPGDECVISSTSTVSRRLLTMPIAGLAQQVAANDGTITGLNVLTNFRGVFFGALSAPAGPAVPPPIIVPIPARYLHNAATIKAGPAGLSAVTDAYFGWRLKGRLLQYPARVPATILSANVFWIKNDGTLGGSFAPFTGTTLLLPVAWVAGGTYSSSTPSYVFPRAADANQTGLYYKCTTTGTGTAAASPPAWPTVIGGTVSESGGGPTWTAWGYGSLPAPPASTLASYYQAGAPQTIRISPVSDVVIDTTQYAYFLQIQPDTCGVGWLWTGLQLAYTNIANLAFE